MNSGKTFQQCKLQLNVSDIVQLIENIGIFSGPEFLPRTWNNGMVEYWDVDFNPP